MLTYVSIPEFRHTHRDPADPLVNVVPQDRQGRVPNPEVEREKILLETQAEKRLTEEALRRGEEGTAGITWRRAYRGWNPSTPGRRDRRGDALPNRTMEERTDAAVAYRRSDCARTAARSPAGTRVASRGGQIDDHGRGECMTRPTPLPRHRRGPQRHSGSARTPWLRGV